jgi:hypothetical protein
VIGADELVRVRRSGQVVGPSHQGHHQTSSSDREDFSHPPMLTGSICSFR